MSYQQGGLIESFQVLLSNLDSPAKLLYGFLLILLIVYAPLIPSEYRVFADSLLGKLFGVVIVYGAVETLGWVYGLLTAFAFLLLLNGSPRFGASSVEGFDGGGTVSEKRVITHGNRWFVEKVLGEKPYKIATDNVTTQPVQD